MSSWAYLLPALPIPVRIILAVIFRTDMRRPLVPESDAKAEARSVALALAAISFTGFIALAILNVSPQDCVAMAMYYFVWSFVSVSWSVYVRAYAARVRELSLAYAFLESSMLALMLSLVALSHLVPGRGPMHYLAFAAVAGWLADFVLRIILELRDLRTRQTQTRVAQR